MTLMTAEHVQATPGKIVLPPCHLAQDITITKRQAFIPMTFAREIMGDANSCVVTLQIMVDGENRRKQLCTQKSQQMNRALLSAQNDD